MDTSVNWQIMINLRRFETLETKKFISQIFADDFTFDFTATASIFWWKYHGLLGGIIQGWFTLKGNLFIKPEEFRDHKCWKAFNTNIIILIVTDHIQNWGNEKRFADKKDATRKGGQERPTKTQLQRQSGRTWQLPWKVLFERWFRRRICRNQTVESWWKSGTVGSIRQ